MAKQILEKEKPVRSLSDYEFIHDPNDKSSKLGVGSFASVKLAKEVKTGKMFAIKMISMEPKKVTSSDLHNIKTEITVHRNLDHPNIVKFYDYIQKDNNIYFVLDFAENGNLYSYLHKRKNFLPQEDVFKFFHQTCLAFQYLHQNDILHRDLKPENLLLDKNCNIKLCDFGWSARRINEKRTTFCGTYEYMAPEIVHKKTYDYRVDIWSLGVLLYELIHKEAPYKGRSLEEISKSLAKPQITFSQNTHPEAKDLILRILKHNPQERLSIQQILDHPWVKYRLQKQKDATTSNVQINEFRVSPREGKAANVEAIQCESPKIQMRKDKENMRAETAATGGDKNILTESMVSPSNKKVSNNNLFHSFNGTLPAREKETEKLKERSREKTKEQSSVHSNDGSIMSQYKGQRRKPLQEFVSNINLKAVKENVIASSSRKHTKSSSSLTSDILEKLAAANERRTPSSQSMSKRLFENTLLSPNFKTKVNSLVHQLTAQTTTHKTSSDLSSVFTTRAANQQTEPNGFTDATSTYRFHTNQNIKHEHQMVYRTKSDNRFDDNSKFSINVSSLNNSKAKMETENMNGRSTPSHPKPVIQVKLNLPKGDNGITVCSPLSNPNRTARSKMDARSPEPVELNNRQISYSDKFGHAHKYSENYITTREDYRKYTKENEVTTSLTSLYKGLDYHRKHVSKFGEELNPSNQPMFVLNERKNDVVRRDFTRDKENRLIAKEEHERNWAL